MTIQSTKHSYSIAISHARDVEIIFTLPVFYTIVRDPNNSIKPNGIFTVDGGSDENPRYQKVIILAFHLFQNII